MLQVRYYWRKFAYLGCQASALTDTLFDYVYVVHILFYIIQTMRPEYIWRNQGNIIRTATQKSFSYFFDSMNQNVKFLHINVLTKIWTPE